MTLTKEVENFGHSVYLHLYTSILQIQSFKRWIRPYRLMLSGYVSCPIYRPIPLSLKNDKVAIRSECFPSGRGNLAPRLNTVENLMKLSQLLVQGVWEGKNTLLQLPYLEEDMLR